jgi:1,3-propanediol dehydrogenase/alcohol dehydrogenase
MTDPLLSFLPTKIYMGENILDRLKECSEWGRRALLVTGRTFALKSGLLRRAEDLLHEEGIETHRFCEVEADPSIETVEKGAGVCRDSGCDCIVTIGGGSPMDTAKGIAVLSKNDGELRNYFGVELFTNEPLPIIAVPTTAGTGSEVTRYAVITDWQAKTKKVVNSFRILPKIAIADPVLTLEMPPSLTAFTGMDAFSHALEGFLSLRANAFSDMLAIDAMKIIADNLPRVVKKPDDLTLRGNMMFGALVAGMVINRTGTIIVHGMGYSLNLDYRLPHGESNALLLPVVIEYLSGEYKEKLERLKGIFGGDIWKIVRKLNAEAGIPKDLKSAGVQESHLEEISRRAINDCVRSLKNVPAKLDIEDFRKMFRQAFDG